MSDLVGELTRFTVVLALWILLLRRTLASPEQQPPGWRLILGGFFLLLLGSAIDITDEYEELARFVVIGDTPVQAFLEKIVFYLGGYVLLCIGFYRWLPVVMSAREANLQLQREMAQRQEAQARLTVQNQELAAAREAALEVNALQNRFIANISHNLRTPLHAIQACAALGKERVCAAQGGDSTGDKLQDYFQRIQGGAQRLGKLVDDLLAIAQLESGRVELNVQREDLRLLIAEVVREEQPLLELQGIRCSTVIETPDPWAAVDRGALKQVISNLLGNVAAHAAAGGRLELGLGDDRLGDVPALLLTCRDWGPGVASAELPRLFDKFTQVQEETFFHLGTGLGLAICRELVELHGGEIHAHNHPSGGLVVTLRLPRTPEQVCAAVGSPDQGRSAAAGCNLAEQR